MTNPDINDSSISECLDKLKDVNSIYVYSKICELNKEQLAQYQILLDDFKKINSSDKATTTQKGNSLERLVRYFLKVSGDLFELRPNLHTCTNEIDIFVTLKAKGKFLHSSKIINKRFDKFLVECKNYKKSISVTYVGKFCSLLLTTTTKLGILFSYRGFTGSGWGSASGLSKKFYLHKENEEDRYCVIDFCLDDFERILRGENFLSIVDAKIEALSLDTDFRKFLSEHPAEKSLTSRIE